jgi:hypothetical protein
VVGAEEITGIFVVYAHRFKTRGLPIRQHGARYAPRGARRARSLEGIAAGYALRAPRATRPAPRPRSTRPRTPRWW